MWYLRCQNPRLPPAPEGRGSAFENVLAASVDFRGERLNQGTNNKEPCGILKMTQLIVAEAMKSLALAAIH